MQSTVLFSGLIFDTEHADSAKKFKEYGRFSDLQGVCATWSSLSISHNDQTDYLGFVKKYLDGRYCKKFTIFADSLFFIDKNDNLLKIHLNSGTATTLRDQVADIASTVLNLYFLTVSGHVGVIDEKSNLTFIKGDQNFSQICAGAQHLLLRTRDGSVFSCGYGSKGQLGHGDCFDVVSETEVCPRRLDFFRGVPVRSISCGKWHNAAVSEIGDLYCWGWNCDGQLGFECTLSALPALVDVGEENLVDACCGGRHTLVLGESGKVYCSGSNEMGQLGMDEASRFREVLLPQEAKAIWCGDYSSFIVWSWIFRLLGYLETQCKILVSRVGKTPVDVITSAFSRTIAMEISAGLINAGFVCEMSIVVIFEECYFIFPRYFHLFQRHFLFQLLSIPEAN